MIRFKRRMLIGTALVVLGRDDHAAALSFRNLPNVQVSDLVVEENDLVIGTHGRSFWVMYNMDMLRQLTPEVAESDVHLFDPVDPVRGIDFGAQFFYYLAEKPPAFWRAVAVGAVAGAGLLLAWGWLYVRLMFALPACVLAETGPIASLKTSLRLTKGSFVRLAAILLVWLLVVAVFGGLLGGLVQIVEYLAIGAAGQSHAWLIPVLAGLVTLNLLTAAIISLARALLLLVTGEGFPQPEERFGADEAAS